MDFCTRGDASARLESRRYFTPSGAIRHLGLFCLGVGWQDGRQSHLPDRVLDCYAAVLVTRGRGELRTGRAGTTSVQGPALFWLHPGLTHSYGPDRRGWSETWVLFDGLSARSYEELGYLDRRQPLVRLAGDDRTSAIVERLVACAARDTPRVAVELAALTHELIVTAPTTTGERETESRDTALVSALRSEACTPLSVVEHARRLRVSLPALRLACRRIAGTSPKGLLVQTRVTRAKALLAHTDVLVAHVAREVGYDDPAYFSRVFTQHAGVSPAEFRRTQLRSVTWGPGDHGPAPAQDTDRSGGAALP